MANISVFLNTPTGPGNSLVVVGSLFVRLHNIATANDYYSTAASDPVTGQATVLAVPPGDYQMFTGTAATVGGTPTMVSPHFEVPVTAGDDIAARSVTVSIGPYGAFLPGAPTVPTPAGVITGKVWDWGGATWDAVAANAKFDGVTDDTAAITAAYNAMITAGSGTVRLGRGVAAISAPLPTISKPTMSVLGPGTSACTLKPTAAVTDFCMRIQTNPFNIAHAGEIGGFTIDGSTAGAGAGGIHYGDVIGLQLRNLVIQFFTASTQVGLYAENATNWTERTLMQKVHLNDNFVGWKLRNTGGLAANKSMEASEIVDLKINVIAGQTGIMIRDDVQFWRSFMSIFANVADTGTVMDVGGTSQLVDTFLDFRAEQTSGVGGTFLTVANGATVACIGFMRNPSGMAVVNNNAAGPNTSLAIGMLDVVNGGPMVLDAGTIANFGGGGNTGTVIPAITTVQASRYGALGMVYGTNIHSSFAAFYDAAGNGFVVYKVPNGSALGAATEVFRVHQKGARLVVGSHQDVIQTPTAVASQALDAGTGNYHELNITSNIAVVVQAPTNTPGAGQSQQLTVSFVNNSGGALGTAPTFATGAGAFLLSGAAVAMPTNGQIVTYNFRWSAFANGGARYREISRTVSF